MNRDEKIFWQTLDLPNTTLVVDNDTCYITYDDDENEWETSKSFDIGPEELAFIFGKKLGIKMEKC